MQITKYELCLSRVSPFRERAGSREVARPVQPYKGAPYVPFPAPQLLLREDGIPARLAVLQVVVDRRYHLLGCDAIIIEVFRIKQRAKPLRA